MFQAGTGPGDCLFSSPFFSFPGYGARALLVRAVARPVFFAFSLLLPSFLGNVRVPAGCPVFLLRNFTLNAFICSIRKTTTLFGNLMFPFFSPSQVGKNGTAFSIAKPRCIIPVIFGSLLGFFPVL